VTPEQRERFRALRVHPNRIAQLEDAITAYSQRTLHAVPRVTEWVLSDMARGLSIQYILGWLLNTT
jgi:seryl-tRNA(Sec) selenium transferase